MAGILQESFSNKFWKSPGKFFEVQSAISQFSVQQLREFSEIFKTPLDGCFCRLLCWVHWRWITKTSVTSFDSFKILSRSKKSFGINVNLESILITTQVFLVQMLTCYFLLGTQHAICQAACCTLFFSKNKIILAEAHYSYFLVDFRLIWSYFALATTVNKQKGITVEERRSIFLVRKY